MISPGGVPRASAGLLIIAFLGPLVLGFSANRDPQGVRQALEEARALRAQIAQLSNPTREQYLRCIQTYRQVYARDPHYSGSDDAIWEAGQLYQQMGDRFGAPEYYREAVRFFRFLVSDYGASPFCPDALLRAGDLCAGPLQDKHGAEAAYEQLRSQYPHSRVTVQLASRPEVVSAARGQSRPQPAAKEETTKPTPASPAPVSELPLSHPPASAIAVVESIRHWTTTDYTRVTIDLDREIHYEKGRLANPDRVYLDIANASVSKDLEGKSLPVEDNFLKQIRVAQNRSDTVRVVLDLESIDQYTVSEMHNPFRIVVDIQGKRTASHSAAQTPDSKARADEIVAAAAKQPSPPEPKINRGPLARSVQGQATEQPKPVPANKELAPVPVKAGETQAKINETQSLPVDAQGQPSLSTPARADTLKTRAETKEAAPPPQSRPSETSGSPIESRNRSSAPTDTKKTTDVKAAIAAVPQLKPDESRPTVPEKRAQPAPTNAVATGVPKTGAGQPTSPSDTRGRPPASSPIDIPKPALPTSRGDRTLTRVLGLKISRIVIDPGHGGYDTGTIGPSGLMEKDLVLEIAKDLKRLLEKKLGAQVFLTREDDAFVPLEERALTANQHQADLFISIHANSSSTRSASGVETYYLDFARSASEREVAARENAATSQNVRDLEELIKQIVEADKSKESRELASIVQTKLFADSQHLFPMTHNRGVRRAPFVVLIGANMPSILAEVAFISNPRDERLLKKQDIREGLAQALFAGIERYAKALGSFVTQDQVKLK